MVPPIHGAAPTPMALPYSTIRGNDGAGRREEGGEREGKERRRRDNARDRREEEEEKEKDEDWQKCQEKRAETAWRNAVLMKSVVAL